MCGGVMGTSEKIRPLPNCGITKIREIYPEESGIYAPYKTTR